MLCSLMLAGGFEPPRFPSWFTANRLNHLAILTNKKKKSIYKPTPTSVRITLLHLNPC